MKKLIFLFALVVTLFSCTENERAKIYGGKLDYRLKPNEVLINATWKEGELWILSKDTITGIHYFREKSNFGMMEGEVIIKNDK